MDDIQPDIRFENEARFFRVAVADDGETLPSQIHPSHPYGDVYRDAYSSSSRIKALPQAKPDGSSDPDDRLSARLSVRAQQSVAPNVPRWPFTRFGPGPGGPSSLIRNELERPWRPYRSVWAETDLGSLLGKQQQQRRRQQQQAASTTLVSAGDIFAAQRRPEQSAASAGQTKWGVMKRGKHSDSRDSAA